MVLPGRRAGALVVLLVDSRVCVVSLSSVLHTPLRLVCPSAAILPAPAPSTPPAGPLPGFAGSATGARGGGVGVGSTRPCQKQSGALNRKLIGHGAIPSEHGAGLDGTKAESCNTLTLGEGNELAAPGRRDAGCKEERLAG